MRVREVTTRPLPQAIRELFSRMVLNREPLIKIRRSEISYWQERGWVRDGHRYTGTYQTRYGSFRGYCDQKGLSFFRFYIYQPPEELRRHSHWKCFLERDRGWYEVHMGRMPADISSGILAIERLITEAFEQ